MNVTIIPLKAIVFPNGELCFGDKKSSEGLLSDLFGNVQNVRNRRYYDDDIAVESDENGICAVEFLSGVNGSIRPVLYDCSVFEMPADELVALLMKKDDDGRTPDGGYTYYFPNIGIGLYREITPDDIAEMRQEMINDGINPDDNEDFKADRIRAEHWATITSASLEYYSK